MEACEAYEEVELDTLSVRIKSIGHVLKRRIRRLKHSVNTRYESILVTLMLSQSFPVCMRTLSKFYRQSIKQQHLCMQEILYRYPDRGTWTSVTPKTKQKLSARTKNQSPPPPPPT